jgi:GNAT superfamily N-acetyltransferase
MIFSDKTLSQKLERAEGRFNAAFVESRARLCPEIGAAWIDVGGTYAMFDGPASPCTQTFGLGLFDDVTDAALDENETFFIERDAPVFHEVSPMADPSIMELLHRRGYKPIELSTVMFTPLANRAALTVDPRITTRVIEPDEADLWTTISAEAWLAEMPELSEFFLGLGKTSVGCEGGMPFLAELDGRPIATGMLLIEGEVALLAGASTIPEARRQGAQIALLDARLRFAAERGATLASMTTAPGSQSQRNGQKNGFQIAYTRTKWQLMR